MVDAPARPQQRDQSRSGCPLWELGRARAVPIAPNQRVCDAFARIVALSSVPPARIRPGYTISLRWALDSCELGVPQCNLAMWHMPGRRLAA